MSFDHSTRNTVVGNNDTNIFGDFKLTMWIPAG